MADRGEGGLRPPSVLQRFSEALLPRDVARLTFRAGSGGLGRLTRGTGRPVIVLPGVGGSDLTLIALRRQLARLGHDSRRARLGHVGATADAVVDQYQRLRDMAEAVAEETGDRPAVVGWSIGGVLAREAARDSPDIIRRVVTFGSPVIGGPTYTALTRLYSNLQLAEIAELIEHRNHTPLKVPVTAIWSRRDGIVAADACIDPHEDVVEHVEVGSTHVGMVVDPDVWTIVADRLAADD